MKVISISLLTLLSIVFAITGLRFYGVNQAFAPYIHPFFDEGQNAEPEDPLIIAYGGESKHYPSHSLIAIDAARKLSSVIIWLDIRLTQDGQFVAFPGETLGEFSNGSGPFNAKTLAELKELDAAFFFKSQENTYPYRGFGLKILSLDEVMQKYPAQRFILNIMDNVKDVDLMLEAAINRLKCQDRVIIHSQYDVVLSSLKRLMPRLLFGMGEAEKTKFLMLDGLWLEPLAPIKGDVFIAPLKRKSVSTLSANMREDLKRRYKKVFLGPLSSKEDFDAAKKLAPEGYITDNPLELKDWL